MTDAAKTQVSAQERPLLEVRDLAVRFDLPDGSVRAVNRVSYRLNRGEALGIVGESGSGKSVSTLSILGLIPSPPGVVESGEVLLNGRDLLQLPLEELRRVRGNDIAMIFQDPMTSLNPVLSVGYQLTEVLRAHLELATDEARDRAVELLDLVGIPNAATRISEFPHQFSGGQRQRIMIAIALACDPSILLADEPTTALDVTIQAQVVDLIKALQTRLGMSIIWITHDLALVAGIVDRVAVMYAGSIVELADVESIFAHPAHPYTHGLLRSIPSWQSHSKTRLDAIPGAPPNLQSVIPGCPFAPRCPYAREVCVETRPQLVSVGPGRESACLRWPEIREELRPL